MRAGLPTHTSMHATVPANETNVLEECPAVSICAACRHLGTVEWCCVLFLFPHQQVCLHPIQALLHPCSVATDAANQQLA